MYALVFTILVVSVLGLYTQVIGLQAARLAASQTSIADSMITWHFAAMSLAANVINPVTTPMGLAGCSVTPGLTTPAYCVTGNNVTQPGVAATVQLGTTYQINNVSYPQLPANYNTALYAWKSVVFQANNAYYLVTYVDPATTSATNPPPGFISTAAGVMLKTTESDLRQQLQNSTLPYYSYGLVTASGGNRVMNLPPIISGGVSIPLSYTLPGSVPGGALAIISNVTPCTSC